MFRSSLPSSLNSKTFSLDSSDKRGRDHSQIGHHCVKAVKFKALIIETSFQVYDAEQHLCSIKGCFHCQGGNLCFSCWVLNFVPSWKQKLNRSYQNWLMLTPSKFMSTGHLRAWPHLETSSLQKSLVIMKSFQSRAGVNPVVLFKQNRDRSGQFRR